MQITGEACSGCWNKIWMIPLGARIWCRRESVMRPYLWSFSNCEMDYSVEVPVIAETLSVLKNLNVMVKAQDNHEWKRDPNMKHVKLSQREG